MIVQAQSGNALAWRNLVQLYGCLIYYWCRQKGLSAEDAADVTQDVFASVAKGLPSFDHQRPNSSFRGWLRVITGNRIRDFCRRRLGPTPQGGTTALHLLRQIPGDNGASVDDTHGENPEVERLHAALAQVRESVEERTWLAFWGTTLEQRPASEVAQELGGNRQAIFAAKSRVMRMLRQVLESDSSPGTAPK